MRPCSLHQTATRADYLRSVSWCPIIGDETYEADRSESVNYYFGSSRSPFAPLETVTFWGKAQFDFLSMILKALDYVYYMRPSAKAFNELHTLILILLPIGVSDLDFFSAAMLQPSG